MLHPTSDLAQNRGWVTMGTPPSEARPAELVGDELERRDADLKEAIARSGTLADLDDERGWEPLDRMIGRVRVW